MATKVIFSRVDLAANFTSSNPILALGETGWEQDTEKIKVGDGVTAWNSLPYQFKAETDTTLSKIGNTLRYIGEDGTNQDIDLSIYIDDTNLSRLVSGSINGSGLATFTRDDTSTFNIDFSSLFDDTNLSRIVSGAISGTNLILTRSDSSTITTDVTSLIQDLSVFYTKSELDGGQLDNRYYTQEEINNLTYHDVVERTDPLINQTVLNENYLNKDFVLPELGNYLCTINLVFSYDVTNSNYEGEAIIDGVTYPFLRYEPQDSAGTGITANTTTLGSESTGTDQRITASFTKKLVGVSGTINAAYWFGAQTNGAEATTYSCTIEMKRVL